MVVGSVVVGEDCEGALEEGFGFFVALLFEQRRRNHGEVGGHVGMG